MDSTLKHTLIKSWLAVFPALFGAVFFFNVNLFSLPREIEALIAVILAIGVLQLSAWAAQTILKEETLAEQMLRSAGMSEDARAGRAARAAEAAYAMLDRMSAATEGRTQEFKSAVTDFRMAMEPLLTAIVADPSIQSRADTMLKRTLPRLTDAVESYAGFAEKGTELVDPTELRRRVVSALQEAGQHATAARKAGLEGQQDDVQIALEIAEESFAYARR